MYNVISLSSQSPQTNPGKQETKTATTVSFIVKDKLLLIISFNKKVNINFNKIKNSCLTSGNLLLIFCGYCVSRLSKSEQSQLKRSFSQPTSNDSKLQHNSHSIVLQTAFIAKILVTKQVKNAHTPFSTARWFNQISKACVQKWSNYQRTTYR